MANNIAFAIRTYTTDTTAKIVVISANSTTPDNISGLSGSWSGTTSVGTDSAGGVTDSGDGAAGVALYSWIWSETGLTPNTQYSITVVQDGSSRDATIRTQPAASGEDDFTIFVVSCDYSNASGDDKGCWGYIHDVAETENVVAVVHQDDHGYIDTLTYGASGTTPVWNAVSCSVTPRAYGYACGYALYLGLIDETTVVNNSAAAARLVTPDRIWCATNIPFFVQVGDHEFINNPEENTSMTATHKADALEAWNGTIGAAMPYISSDSRAWVAEIGPIEVISYDRCGGLTAATQVFDKSTTAGEGQYPFRATARTTTVDNRWLGATQISDIQGAMNDTSQFKMLSMSTGSRFMMSRDDRLTLLAGATWTNTAWLGAQQPLHGYTAVDEDDSEWLELMTETNGVCERANSYGAVVFGVHGDTHHPGTQYLYYGDYIDGSSTRHSQVSMYQFSAGSVNGEAHQPLHPAIVEGYSYEGNHQTYVPSWVDRTGTIGIEGESTCLRIDATKASGDWVLNVQTIEVNPTTDAGTVVSSVLLRHGTAANHPAHLRSGWI